MMTLVSCIIPPPPPPPLIIFMDITLHTFYGALSSFLLSTCPTHFIQLVTNLPLATSLCADRHIILSYHIIKIVLICLCYKSFYLATWCL